jgi:hypothetical protein
MSKARDLGNLLDTGGDVVSGSLDNVPTPSKTSIEALDIALPAANLTGTLEGARLPSNISDAGTEGTKIAVGTTAQRGSTTGQWRFNSTTGKFEGRDATGHISLSFAPSVTSVDDSNFLQSEIDAGQDIVITGTGFVSGAVASFGGQNATTTTIDSATQITARIPTDLTSANDPFAVTITNSDGLTGTLSNAFNIDEAPAWNTASGTVATITDEATGTHATLTATDPDGTTVTYSEVGSVLSGFGFTLNTSTGAITGDPTDVAASTTRSFTLRATDQTAQISDRAYNIVVTPLINGTSKAKAVTVSAVQNPITQVLAARGESDGAITEGVYWTYSTNTAASSYYSATAYRNIGGSTWMLMQKNYTPHAHKNGDSVSTLDHPLAYGLMNNDGSTTVATNTNLGNSANNTAASLGDFHLRVPIDTFGDNIFTKCGGYGKNSSTFGKATITASTLMDIMKNAQAYSNSNYYYAGWGWYPCDGHNLYLVFWARDSSGDSDYGRMGFTGNAANGHDTHNTASEYNGISWLGDNNSNYTGSSYDHDLNGSGGRLSIWVQ